MRLNKRILINIFSLFVVQGSNYILPLITFPYLVRTLGSDKYGLLVFATAIMQYFIIITDYGFNLSATRKIAIEKENKRTVNLIFSRVLFIKLIFLLTCIFFLTILIFNLRIMNNHWQIYILTFINVIGTVMFPIWIFQGLEEMKYITILNIVAKILTTILLFLIVKEPQDYLMAAFIQSLNFVIPGFVSFFILKVKFSIKFRSSTINFSGIKAELKEGFDVFIASLSGNIYGQGAVVITGLIAGTSAAGYYSIAQKIGSALVGLSQPIAQGIYPYICKLYLKNYKEYTKFKRFILAFGISFGLVMSFLIYFNSDFLVNIVNGSHSFKIEKLMRLFSFVILFTILNVLLNPFILSMDKNKELKRIYIFAAILFLILALPLTILFNNIGMAYSILVVEIFIFINSLISIKEVKLEA